MSPRGGCVLGARGATAGGNITTTAVASTAMVGRDRRPAARLDVEGPRARRLALRDARAVKSAATPGRDCDLRPMLVVDSPAVSAAQSISRPGRHLRPIAPPLGSCWATRSTPMPPPPPTPTTPSRHRDRAGAVPPGRRGHTSHGRVRGRRPPPAAPGRHHGHADPSHSAEPPQRHPPVTSLLSGADLAGCAAHIARNMARLRRLATLSP
jgi:hypothetical protein